MGVPKPLLICTKSGILSQMCRQGTNRKPIQGEMKILYRKTKITHELEESRLLGARRTKTCAYWHLG